MTCEQATYRARIVYDEEGVDIGDWLPQDEEHYNKVGPFTPEDHNGLRFEATWEIWWARDESRVENWESYGMLLMKTCGCCGEESDADESLWGLDYMPSKTNIYSGDYTREELVKMDSYLGDIFDELVSQAEYAANKAAA